MVHCDLTHGEGLTVQGIVQKTEWITRLENSQSKETRWAKKRGKKKNMLEKIQGSTTGYWNWIANALTISNFAVFDITKTSLPLFYSLSIPLKGMMIF